MGQALSWASREEEEEARVASPSLSGPLNGTDSTRLALVPIGTHRNFSQELAVAPPHFRYITTSGGRGRNGGGGVTRAFFEAWLTRRDFHSHFYDLEAGQAHWVGTRGTGGGAAPIQEPNEVDKKLQRIMVQAFATFLPGCVTAYPVFKDAPPYVQLISFVGLALTTFVLFVGILTRSVARRKLTFRLVFCSAIALLTFIVGSLLSGSGPTYVATTAFVGVVLNLIIMLLPFEVI